MRSSCARLICAWRSHHANAVICIRVWLCFSAGFSGGRGGRGDRLSKPFIALCLVAFTGLIVMVCRWSDVNPMDFVANLAEPFFKYLFLPLSARIFALVGRWGAFAIAAGLAFCFDTEVCARYRKPAETTRLFFVVVCLAALGVLYALAALHSQHPHSRLYNLTSMANDETSETPFE